MPAAAAFALLLSLLSACATTRRRRPNTPAQPSYGYHLAEGVSAPAGLRDGGVAGTGRAAQPE
jgi:hypothetical protein